VTLTDRDRKILIAVVPIVIVVAYWFLLLAPKREDAATAGDEVAKQEQRRDDARAALSQASTARTGFRGDYTQIVRLGKAIPAGVDMPSLLVQLDRAAEGTGIRFTSIKTGERSGAGAAAPATAGSPPPAGTGQSSGTTPVQAGGQPAQSAPGTAAESANNAAATSSQSNQAATQSGVSPGDTQTSTSAREGGLPVGGGAATGGSADQAGTAPVGLETVSLELGFVGDFFRLADFFHSVKRFVHVASKDVVVDGRLITIEGVRYTSDPLLFPRLKAEITATVYLSPLEQGVTAGATPQGPSTTTPAAGTDGSAAPASPTTPTATATP
jgi:type IV pilus assembly protein PilO